MTPPAPLAELTVRVADWIERTRTVGGYGGPVAHWWRDCLVDCRSGHDWRYEGIICGYLELHARSGDERWLARARRAGDDVVQAQGDGGLFERSAFELNPRSGGTPHEAAASIGLLRLSLALRTADRPASDLYLGAARRNLVEGHVGRLWDPAVRAFRDVQDRPSFVPNKACTLIEALLLLAAAVEDGTWVDDYAVPTAEAVLRHQVRSGPLAGAIAQNSLEGQLVAKYFPYYAARCIPGLLQLADATGDGRFREAAIAAGRFVARSRDGDGGFPQVIYADGGVNAQPRWVAGLGDVLRAMALLEPFDVEWDASPTEARLVGAVGFDGAVPTATGFAGTGAGDRADEADLRDLLPVTGWMDKAFRYLAGRAGVLPGHERSIDAPTVRRPCTHRGRPGWLTTDGIGVRFEHAGRVAYDWRFGEGWAIADPWVVVR